MVNKYTKYIFLAISLLTLNAFAKPNLQTLKLNGHIVTFDEGLGSLSADSLGYNAGLIHIKGGISISLRQKIDLIGIKGFKYAGASSFYLYSLQNNIDKLLSLLDDADKIYNFAEIKPKYKISQDIISGNVNDWAKDSDGKYILNLSLLATISKDELQDMMPSVQILMLNNAFQKAKIKMDPNRLNDTLSIPIIYNVSEISASSVISGSIIDDNQLLTLKTPRNRVSAGLIGVDKLRDKYNLYGKNMKVGVVEWPENKIDQARVRRDHVEFGGRVSIINWGNNSKNSLHATHVAGTIGAKGIEIDARGMANKVNIYSFSARDSYDSSESYHSLFYGRHNISYGWSLPYLLDRGITVSNHSYGSNPKLDYYENKGGHYGIKDQSEDEFIMSKHKVLMFKSAGNSRIGNKYSTTLDASNAKNIFTIGNVYDNKLISYDSDVGPTADGRIKPDLVANGTTVYSLGIGSNTDYDENSGTSMATPAATGAAILLKELYKKRKGMDITADTMKALMVNTAKDLGRPGPDYEYGFGLIQADKAGDIIATGSKIRSRTITDSRPIYYKFHNSYTRNFKATLSWIDLAGNTLMDDLDLTLLDSNAKLITPLQMPYCLNQDYPKQNAYFCLNIKDNTELLEYKNLPKGDYTLKIYPYLRSGKAVKYSLVSSISLQKSIKNDYNGDGISDIFWRNNKGINHLWLMKENGSRQFIPQSFKLTKYKIVGIGDFNGDGIDDILWRRGSNNYLWLMKKNGGHKYKLISSKPWNYRVVGIGDFNGDGIDDIFWRRESTNSIWFMKDNGSHKYKLESSKSLSYKVAGVGDFNGDGIDDIFWRRGTSNSLWFMKGNSGHKYMLKSSKSLSYEVANIGDYNGDGIDDILWRNGSGTSLWFMKENGSHKYKKIKDKSSDFISY